MCVAALRLVTALREGYSTLPFDHTTNTGRSKQAKKITQSLALESHERVRSR